MIKLGYMLYVNRVRLGCLWCQAKYQAPLEKLCSGLAKYNTINKKLYDLQTIKVVIIQLAYVI